MATYNLNEILKERAASAAPADAQEMRLDDVARVKVLSPGRQVFKRFIRNRLAVFGSMTLIVMFIFSFLGPLVYPYGQKQIFYRYDTLHSNYAMARENTAYLGYVSDPEIDVERQIQNAMNSNIKTMLQQGLTTMTAFGADGAYQITELYPDIYELATIEATPIASAGSGSTLVGTYSQLSGEIEFTTGTIDGLLEAVQENLRSDSFTLDGQTYRLERGAAKSYQIYVDQEGLRYYGTPLDAGFEKALDTALESGAQNFSYGGDDYSLRSTGGTSEISRLGSSRPVMVFSRLTMDTYEVGAPVSDELYAQVFLHANNPGTFTLSGGDSYTLEDVDGTLLLRDANGNEYGEMTPFVVRRYTGEDTIEYNLKKALASCIEEMIASDRKEGSIVYALPQQTEDGQYSYDENGNLLVSDTEMLIAQQGTGEYVISCDQVIYVIDMFSSPSGQHILGTDGDGFDVMARIMYGGRISLMVGFVVVFLEIFLGVIMGGLAGYYGGWVDNVIMRLVDIFYCLPSLPIMIILGAMMDALRMNTYVRLLIMMAALGIMGWASVARLVRGQILSLREQEFMVAAEASGIQVRHRIFRHLVPNVMPQLIVTATMGMGGVILTESTLSYLGLGVKHPLATWGTIINSVSSASAMAHYAHIWIPVGLLICLTVIAFNFVGDGLRDAYDPRGKR